MPKCVVDVGIDVGKLGTPISQRPSEVLCVICVMCTVRLLCASTIVYCQRLQSWLPDDIGVGKRLSCGATLYIGTNSYMGYALDNVQHFLISALKVRRALIQAVST